MLVEGGQQGIEHTIVAFECFIKENDLRLGNFPGSLHRRLTAVEQGQDALIPFGPGDGSSSVHIPIHQIRVIVDLRLGPTHVLQRPLVPQVPVQHGLGHLSGDQSGQVHAPEKLFFVRLLGEQALKLPGAGDPGAEAVDGVALGLTGRAQDKQVFAGEQGDGDHLHQLRPLGHIPVDLRHDGEHFVM